MANLVRKVRLFSEATGRATADLVSSFVLQHSYDPAQVLAATALLKKYLGDDINIVPTLLPVTDTRLFNAFSREGFAAIPEAVNNVVRKIESAKDDEEREKAKLEGDAILVERATDLARQGFTDIAFYHGISAQEGKRVRGIIQECCDRGVFRNVPHPDKAISSVAAQGVIDFGKSNQLS